MKRKRGHKKGRPKGNTNPVSVTLTHEQEEEEEEEEDEEEDEEEEASAFDIGSKEDNNSGMEVDTPSSTGTDQHSNLANINPDGSIFKSVGRVKVKLKTSKMLDSQPNSSDAPSQSDTDKSSQQQHGLERHGVNADRIEDSVTSLPDLKFGASYKKAGSIKIKSSKVLGLNADQTTKPLPISSEIIHPKERKTPPLNPRYNKHELDTSLMIIRKVMKMDAAEPFNVPVNPEALGIPDYFDIIDTPMDFGTICSNLEKNDKYMNSEDVYNDVRYIWENCYKYNNKGDYIVDLMKRVKKNFMKYWAAAGLYSEQPKGSTGTERTTEDIALSGDGKAGKGGQLKHKKKKHGRHHKHDCLCAICVLKRRRKEREENDRIAKGNFGSGSDNHGRDFKQEVSMLVEIPGGEDSLSNTDELLGTDGDVDDDKGEVTMIETSEKNRSPSDGKHEVNEVDDDGMEEENHGLEDAEEEEEEDGEGENEEEIEMNREKRRMDETLRHGGTLAEESEVGDTAALHDEYKTTQQEGQAAVVQQQKKHKEPQDKHQKAKLLESLCSENPMLSSLCGTLFPKNSRSVWSGPHSLIHQRKSAHTSSIHAAIGSFME